MEKPLHLKNHQQLIDFFIRQTAKKTLVDETIVDILIKDQWKQANIAARSLQEIEITGLGTFFPSSKKSATRYINLFNAYHFYKDSTDPRHQSMITNAKEGLKALSKIKLYDQLKGYIRKQASHIICDKEFGISEEGNRSSSSTEISNM